MRSRQLLMFPAAASLLTGLAGCPSREVSEVDPNQDLVEVKELPVNLNRKLDLLFVIDDSGSMANNISNITNNFSNFINVLETIPDGMGGFSLPDVHIGVVSSDAGCGNGSEDDGNLQTTRHIITENPDGEEVETGTEACAMLNGNQFISDIANTDGSRDTNYSGNLADAFTCIASVGIEGCGFEQHLEAMKRAITKSQTGSGNNGFIRDDAYLAVVILADEDDCSAGSPNLFNASEANGVRDSFRCFEYGVSCDQDPRPPGDDTGPDPAETLTNCVPNEDDPTIIEPISTFIDFLREDVKDDPRDVIVATIIGNPDNVSVGQQSNDDNNPGWYKLMPSCALVDGDELYQAAPGVRLNAFRQAFPDRNAFTTICDSDLSDGLETIARLLGRVIGNPCIEGVLADTNGTLPGLQAECSASMLSEDGTGPEETLPQCNEGNTNTPCWRLVEEPECNNPEAGNLSIKLEWGGPAPADKIVSVQCATENPNAE
jgi:hypothetical protein